jgi:uncharacterized DUF497 family protein
VIGTIRGVVLLYVAHAIDERDQVEVVRIISARLADRRERRRYGQNH